MSSPDGEHSDSEREFIGLNYDVRVSLVLVFRLSVNNFPNENTAPVINYGCGFRVENALQSVYWNGHVFLLSL